MARHPEIKASLLIGDDRVSANPKLNNCVKGWRAAVNGLGCSGRFQRSNAARLYWPSHGGASTEHRSCFLHSARLSPGRFLAESNALS